MWWFHTVPVVSHPSWPIESLLFRLLGKLQMAIFQWLSPPEYAVMWPRRAERDSVWQQLDCSLLSLFWWQHLRLSESEHHQRSWESHYLLSQSPRPPFPSLRSAALLACQNSLEWSLWANSQAAVKLQMFSAKMIRLCYWVLWFIKVFSFLITVERFLSYFIWAVLK